MSEFTRTDFYFILIFWVVLPSVDQYTDIFMILKLLGGPNDEQNVTSGIFKFLAHSLRFYNVLLVLIFPVKEKFEGRFSDQPRMIQVLYQKVDIFIFYTFYEICISY